MRHRLACLSLCMVAATTSGCGSTPPPRTNVRSATSEYITMAEIDRTPASNAYDLVNRLRPRWLQAQRTASIGGGSVRSQVIAVYLDDTRLGTVDALRSLSVAGFRGIEYYDATRAATVLRDVGSQPIAGAIVIRTNRTPP